MSASTACTPIVQPLPPFSPDLHSRVDASFRKLRQEKMTRRTTKAWEMELRSSLSEPDIISITKWLAASTAMEPSILPEDTIIQAFLNVQLLDHYHQRNSALRELAGVQKQLDKLLFGTNGTQQHQHNLFEDLTEALSENQEDESEEEDFISTPTTEISSPFSSESHSPEHKRQRFSEVQDPSPLPLSLPPISFQEFDGLPILARNKSKWNKLLRATPGFWLKKSTSWANSLQISYNHRQEATDNNQQQYYQSVVDVLREMRQVQPSIYHDQAWKTAVKTSNLHSIVKLWSDPRCLVLWKSDFMQILIRKHRIHESLALVLLNWIPEEVTKLWAEEDFFEVFIFQTQGKKITKSKELIRAIKKNPDIIPRRAYPSSIFFLLSLENFELALEQWLIYGLEDLGYNVRETLANKSPNIQIYDNIWPYLYDMVPTFFADIDASLLLILQRSMSFRKLIDKPPKHILKNKAQTLNTSCQKCCNLPPKYHCMQKIMVTPQKLEDKYLGCGISLAEPRDYIKPIPIPHSKAGSKNIQPILHPTHLKLKKYEWNDEILKTCGMQLFLIIEEETEKILDFWIYNAFSDDIFQRLVLHHSKLQTVKGLTRGSQFNFYSQGKMFPKGARAPMGGAPGDTYTFYTGMEAVTLKNIEALFDDAEDSMILSEAGRVILLNVYQDLQNISKHGDRLGISGANTYSCNNYTSPLHHDNDAGAGLCAQFDLQAKSELDEYGFIYADYRVYFASRSNSLWYF
ncbi:hypothetical protein GALMADRAFT_75401 [Galerina marginata CBS 339.88]|uniref:Uncharacterized protein n=1 Tax=Galerina marginata (strain CBS 339.88) TaxID=685588 RepID=A0A067SJN7_GALM3|nr:hypothetical protein GALMADRAFT_75401 [Galerina marginata CBS 339.88]